MEKRLLNEKGLTLIELMSVIIIMGIIAVIVIPSIGNIIESSRTKAAKSEALSVLRAADLYFSENYINDPINSISLTSLIEKNYMDKPGYLNDSSFVSDTRPSRLCAAPYGKSKVTFFNATGEEIRKSGKDINVGEHGCGESEATKDRPIP